MKIIELVIDEQDKSSGIEAISVVENPAIELDFIALNKHHEIKFAEVSKEKRILMGAALVPNKNIYRRVKDEEFYVFFSKDTVAKASQLYLKNKYQSNATLEHEKDVTGMTVVESWIVDNPKIDKSAHYGLNVPEGTWMVSMKVDNDDIWNEFVKTGKVKGFSIEGYFADKVEMQETTNEEVQKEIEIIKKIIEVIENSEK